MALFDAIGKQTIYLGRTGDGSVMKLAVNTLIHGINQTFAEAFTLAEAAGIAPTKPRRGRAGRDFNRGHFAQGQGGDCGAGRDTWRRLAAGTCHLCPTAPSRDQGICRPRRGRDALFHARGKPIKKAALFVGSWEGHKPSTYSDWCEALLRDEGFLVDVHDSLAPLAVPENMGGVDLIVPIWSSVRSSHQPEFDNKTKPQENGLPKLIGGGFGISGWHRHMGDAIRDRPTYHFLIGGQFVAHPPGDPVVQDIRSFRLKTEQYYMLVDPSNEVLATTTFSGDHLWWIEGTVIPVVWKRRWDQGRIFYCSIAHTLDA